MRGRVRLGDRGASAAGCGGSACRRRARRCRETDRSAAAVAKPPLESGRRRTDGRASRNRPARSSHCVERSPLAPASLDGCSMASWPSRSLAMNAAIAAKVRERAAANTCGGGKSAAAAAARCKPCMHRRLGRRRIAFRMTVRLGRIDRIVVILVGIGRHVFRVGDRRIRPMEQHVWMHSGSSIELQLRTGAARTPVSISQAPCPSARSVCAFAHRAWLVMQTRVRRERARRPRPAQGFVTKTGGAGMRLSRIGRPRMRVSRTRTSRTRVSAMRTSQTSPTRARRARAMGSRADQGRERGEHTPRPPMPHTRLPHTSRHRRIGGDRRSSPRPRSPIGTTPACRARGNRTGSGRPRSGAVSGRGPGAFVALCRASAFAFDIWPFDPRPDPLLHRPASSIARAKYTRETIRAARAAGNPCARRRETAAPDWTNPAGREAPGGKARGRGHIGTSARATPRAAPVTRLARCTRCSRPPARSVTLAPTLIPAPALAPARHTPSVAARSRLRASLGGAHRVAPRTVTSRRCLAARRPIRHTVILSCARNARGRPGRYRLHRPLVNPASRRARRDHASNAAITSHI